MTLILAIPSQEGIAFASDGQLTRGEVRTSGQKLFKLNNHCAWSASGELALIQRVRELIGTLPGDQLLEQLRDRLAEAIKQCLTTLLGLDFRTTFFRDNPQALLGLHPGDFVFVECRQEQRILHITSYGTPEWIDRPFATGMGAPFAYALVQKYQGRTLRIEQASVLALKVIEEAIEVGAYGLGPSITIWHVTKDGVTPLEEARIAALRDTAGQIREAEVNLLLKDDIALSDQGSDNPVAAEADVANSL